MVAATFSLSHDSEASTDSTARQRKQAQVLLKRGEFGPAATILHHVYDVTARRSDLLAASIASRQAMQLDEAELGLTAITRDRRATSRQKATATQQLQQIRLIRQALAQARIDAREYAAEQTSRYFMDQLQKHNEAVAAEEARAQQQAQQQQLQQQAQQQAQLAAKQQKTPTQSPQEAHQRQTKAGLVALTVSGLMLVGKALFASEGRPQQDRGMMLLKGGVVAGMATALLVAGPGREKAEKSR